MSACGQCGMWLCQPWCDAHVYRAEQVRTEHAAMRAERDSLATQLERMRRERDEARDAFADARAQLVQRGMEIDALVSEKRTAVEAFHEATRLRVVCQESRICAERERDEARAKLARVTDVLRKVRVPTEYEWSSLPESAIRRVLRIIDEKEGGM